MDLSEVIRSLTLSNPSGMACQWIYSQVLEVKKGLEKVLQHPYEAYKPSKSNVYYANFYPAGLTFNDGHPTHIINAVVYWAVNGQQLSDGTKSAGKFTYFNEIANHVFYVDSVKIEINWNSLVNIRMVSELMEHSRVLVQKRKQISAALSLLGEESDNAIEKIEEMVNTKRLKVTEEINKLLEKQAELEEEKAKILSREKAIDLELAALKTKMGEREKPAPGKHPTPAPTSITVPVPLFSFPNSSSDLASIPAPILFGVTDHGSVDYPDFVKQRNMKKQ